MTYELVNPSDPYTMTAEDLEVAAVACSFLGQGAYALKDGDGKIAVPIMLFGGSKEWFQDTFGASVDDVFERVINTKRAALTAALRSVVLTSKERSSLNDIGGRAKLLALRLQEAAC